MMPSPRPRNTRQALAALQYALGTVARPNPLVLAWWWRYELGLGIGLPVLLLVLVGVRGMLVTLVTLAVLTGVSVIWAPSQRYLADRAWCVITPHRVRVGCAQGWIHSRRGKIPTVLLTTRQPFGERVHLWCRAGTSIEDFASALPLLVAACWASGIQVTGNQRYAQMIALDVIRRSPDNQVHAGEPVLPPDGIPAPRFPLDDMDDVGDGPQPWPFGPYHKGSWNPFSWPNR
jgi:hypothetical protein